eukprot:tig00020902_g15002.t1
MSGKPRVVIIGARRWLGPAPRGTRSGSEPLSPGAPGLLPPLPAQAPSIANNNTAELARSLILARILEKVAHVTLIEAKTYFEHNLAIPRALVNENYVPHILVDHREYLGSTYIIVGRVEEVRPEGVRVQNRADPVPYDFLVVATGLSYGPWKALESTREERVQTLQSFRDQGSYTGRSRGRPALLAPLPSLGTQDRPAAASPPLIDRAPALPPVCPQVTIVHSGPRLLDDMASEKAQAHAEKFFASRNAKVHVAADVTVVAIGGGTPNSGFMRAAFPQTLDATGRIRVEKTLQVVGQPNIFCIGDVSDFPDGRKGAYAAQLHADVCGKNIERLIKKGAGAKLREHKPAPAGGLVTLGPGDGILSFPKFTATGWLPRAIKSKDMFVKSMRKGVLGLKTPKIEQ